MRRWVVAAVAVVGLVLAVGLVVSTDSRPESASAEAGAGAFQARGGRLASPRASTPREAGSLRIQGVVLDDGGPVAGVRVFASRPERGQTLSELRCPEQEPAAHPREDGPRLLDCLGRATRQVVELVSAREGEAPVYAEALTDGDGTFVLEGLPAGTFALWAESQDGVVLRPGVPAGAEGVELLLTRGVVLEGAVDGEGAPLPEAQVTVVHTRHTRFFDARTGPDGRFRVAPLPDEDCVLVVTAEGWLPGLFWPGKLRTAEPRLTLFRPRHLTGRVEAGGAAAPGAQVRLAPAGPLPEGPEQALAADEEGRFTFSPLPPGEYLLTAEHGGRHALARVELGSPPAPEVVLVLGGALVVEGLVHDEARRPVAGADVSVASQEPHLAPPDTRTGPDGRYRLGPLEPGSYRFHVSAPRYHRTSFPEQRLEPGMEPLDFQLTRTTTVEGRVVDPEGQPARDVTLRLHKSEARSGEPGFVDTVRSDEDGRFVLDATAPGDYRLETGSESFLPGQQSVRAPAEDVQVVVLRGASVSGTVADEQGVPLPQVSLTLWDAEAAGRRVRSTAPDEAGRFVLQGLRPGRYVLEATRSEDALERTVSRTLTLAEDGQVEVSLRFETGWTLSGYVVDRSGRPVEGALVRAQLPRQDTPRWQGEEVEYGADERAPPPPKGVRSGPEGRFTLRHLVAGTYALTVLKEGFTCASSRAMGGDSPDGCVRVSRGTSEVRIGLERLGVIQGRLIGPDGAPITSFRVEHQALRDEEGVFTLPIYTSGTRSLRIDAPGMAPLLRVVEVREGEDLDLGTLRMEPGRRVRGEVLDAETSAPVKGARVMLMPWSLDSQALLPPQEVLLTKEDGTFELSQVEARPLTLAVEGAEGYFPQRRVLAPEAREVTVRLEAGAHVEVTVRDARGHPLRASLLFSGDRSGIRFVDVDGHAVIRGLVPGDYTVGPSPHGNARGAALRSQRLRVPASGHVALTFEEAPDAATVRLHVRDASAHHVELVPGGAPPPVKLEDLERVLGKGLRPAWEPTDVAVFHAVLPGRATLLLLKRGTPTRVHVEELEIPPAGTLTRDIYPVWRELPGG